MDNRIIGAIGVVAFVFIAVFFAISVNGLPASIASFISAESLGFVGGVGGSLTFMKKHKIKDGELGESLKNDFILDLKVGTDMWLIILTYPCFFWQTCKQKQLEFQKRRVKWLFHPLNHEKVIFT